jgi:hypothetical protein
VLSSDGMDAALRVKLLSAGSVTPEARLRWSRVHEPLLAVWFHGTKAGNVTTGTPSEMFSVHLSTLAAEYRPALQGLATGPHLGSVFECCCC